MDVTGAHYQLVVVPFNPAIAAKSGDYSDSISIEPRCSPDVYAGIQDASCDPIEGTTLIEDVLTLGIGAAGVVVRAGRGLAVESLANEFRLQYKHILGTRQAARELRVGGSAHLFLNEGTLAAVEAAILERGIKTGVIRGTTRYGLQFTNPVGYRIGADGAKIPLYYGELKLSPDGFYHVIRRTGPATP